MGTLLENEDDLRFSEHMVKTLNTILLTTSELFPLRNSLKNLNTEVGLLEKNIERFWFPREV